MLAPNIKLPPRRPSQPCLIRLPTTISHSTSAMLSEDEFYERWRKCFPINNYQGKVQYPNEDESDMVALIVVDDVPIEVTKDLPIDLYV